MCAVCGQSSAQLPVNVSTLTWTCKSGTHRANSMTLPLPGGCSLLGDVFSVLVSGDCLFGLAGAPMWTSLCLGIRVGLGLEVSGCALRPSDEHNLLLFSLLIPSVTYCSVVTPRPPCRR